MASNSCNNGFSRWIAKKQMQPVGDLNEWEKYVLEARLLEAGSLIFWLMSPAQWSRFPLLSSRTIDIFSIPTMSSEAERVFSGAKHKISDQRLSLHIETIEGLECLKSWFQAGIFTQEDLFQALNQQPLEV